MSFRRAVDIDSFGRLSKAQKNAMNHVAFSGFATSVVPTARTLKQLCEYGYITLSPQRVEVPKLGSIVVKIPVMPLSVHMVWCAYVAEPDEGIGD